MKVFSNLQPLNICMSYQRTLDLVRNISQDHDVEVEFWKDELVKLVENSKVVRVIYSYYKSSGNKNISI